MILNLPNCHRGSSLFQAILDPATAGEITTQTRESIIETHPPSGANRRGCLALACEASFFSSKEKSGKESWAKNSEQLAEGGALRLDEAQL